MTNHHKPSYGTPEQDKTGQAGRGSATNGDLKTDRAEKARIGGQQSNGGDRRRSDG